MFNSELYNKYIKVMNDRCNLENKIDAYIEDWKNGKTILSTEQVENIIDKAYERLEALKQIEKSIHEDVLKMDMLQQQKLSDDIALRTTFGESPTNIKIVDGVLAANAKDSHLIYEKKTDEEMSADKQEMLANLKQRVMNGEITLEQASELSAKINSSFEFYNQEKEIEERHR